MYQPSDEPHCGPAALKHALAVLGKRKSLESLRDVCVVTRNGTSTKNMIRATKRLGLPTLLVQNATLRHLQSALRYRPNKERAVIVSYLYELDENNDPHPDSGHWAVVSSYLASKGRVVLLDSFSGQKKSYVWSEFRSRWIDYDLKHRRVGKRGRFKIVRHWQPQLMMVLANQVDNLPQFQLASTRRY